jgi:hypothetical protein
MHIFLDRAGEKEKKNCLGFLTAGAAFNGQLTLAERSSGRNKRPCKLVRKIASQIPYCRKSFTL